MFCQNCGAQVQPGQAYCVACAKPLTGYGMEQRSRFQQHFRLLGIFWIAFSAFSMIGGAVLLVLANTLFSGFSQHNTAEFLHPLLTVIACFLLLKSLLGIATGWGLLEHLEWARVLAIILAFLAMLQVPFGTALGIYTIWALLSPGADREYKSLAAAA